MQTKPKPSKLPSTLPLTHSGSSSDSSPKKVPAPTQVPAGLIPHRGRGPRLTQAPGLPWPDTWGLGRGYPGLASLPTFTQVPLHLPQPPAVNPGFSSTLEGSQGKMAQAGKPGQNCCKGLATGTAPGHGDDPRPEVFSNRKQRCPHPCGWEGAPCPVGAGGWEGAGASGQLVLGLQVQEAVVLPQTLQRTGR